MSRRPIAYAIAAALVVGLLAWVTVEERLYAGRALPGVMIQGQDVGGLDTPGLTARAQSLAAPELQRPVVVRAASIESTQTAADLGLRPDIGRAVAAALGVGRTGPLYYQLWQRFVLLRLPYEITITYAVDVAVTRDAIARIVGSILADPADAEVTVQDGQLVVTRPSRDGVVVDERSSTDIVIAALARREPVAGLVVAVRRATFSTDHARRMAEPVAQFTTRFPYNPDRINNIRLAAGSFRGLLLAPDVVMSYNRVVGPRDPGRGYRKAPVIVNDILVPGDGGGVCQVSSTLFNAALLADMKVETRTNHSRPVPYLVAGRDATVSYGTIDLRLRNTTGHHLYLWSEVTAHSLTFTIFGPQRQGREVEIVVIDHTWIPAPTHTVTKSDPLLPEGKVKIDAPKRGLRARTIRVVRENGQVVREEVVALNYYKPLPRTIRIGAKGTEREGNGARPIRRASAP